MPKLASQKTVTYLAYLEEIAKMYTDTALEAPELGALRPRPAILAGKFVRARFKPNDLATPSSAP